jgi:hypothetical protein
LELNIGVKMLVLETVIMRSKASNTLFDVVEIDLDGDVCCYKAKGVTFEIAQSILEACDEEE